jgi:quercetin dioxygenase-like cupin family protein
MEDPVVRVSRAEARPPEGRRAGNFDGGVVIQPLYGAPALELLAVFFDAGARTKAHVHRDDQVLHVVEGEGVVGYEDGHRIIRPGDLVRVPAGTWHWHGGTPASAMCHLSIKPPSTEDDWSPDPRDWDAYAGLRGQGSPTS